MATIERAVLAVVLAVRCRCGGCDEAHAGDDEAVIEAHGLGLHVAEHAVLTQGMTRR